ncbi:MAG TPA: hypothetical protein VFF26_07730 [Gallionella sp.]|nr:hypothetical protein [Gallionella sp.]
MSTISTATSAYTNTSNATTQRSAANPVAPEKQSARNTTASTDKAAPSPNGVVVTLSAQARSAPKEVALNSYAPFFAGRDNLPQSFALSNGVTNVSNAGDRTAGGEQKSFKQVALDARASMDAQYAAMKDSGKPFDMNSWEGKDVYTLMNNLDRRALYAVKSNEGGGFTKDEQTMATIIMGQQEGLAMGLYSGPTSKAGTYVSPFNSVSDGFKNGIRFLDSVSSEEKSSSAWAIERASAQITYESAAENEHITPEKLDSEDPIVQLITAAMKAMKHHPNSAWTTGPLATSDDLKRQPWFKDYVSQLDQLMQQAQDKPLLQSDAKLGAATQISAGSLT